MQGLSTLLIVPFVVTVIGGAIVLVIEYFFIQPVRRAIDASIPQSSVSRDWATAMRRAVRLFRAQYYGIIGQWLPRPDETITIEEWDIEKGRATLTLAVNKMLETFEPGIFGFFRVPCVIAKHRLTVDRTGDILALKSIPVDQIRTGYFPRTSRWPLPKTTLAITDRKPPRTEKVDNGVNVIIEFEVENSGRAGKVCPYIEFQVVTTKVDGRYTPKKFNTRPKPFDIPALCVKPFKFTLFFSSPDLPLVEPPHEVKIELYPCPDVQSKS